MLLSDSSLYSVLSSNDPVHTVVLARHWFLRRAAALQSSIVPLCPEDVINAMIDDMEYADEAGNETDDIDVIDPRDHSDVQYRLGYGVCTCSSLLCG
jgi:hypothetical protein